MPVRGTIASPSDLRIPDETKFTEVLEALNDEGRRSFLMELIQALQVAEQTDDLSQVQYVIDAWWVSRLFFVHPDIEKALAATAELAEDDPLYTAAEIGRLLGVA